MAHQTQKTYLFHVNDMHCKSCEITTESELIEHPKVSRVRSSLKTHTVEISGDFGEASLDEIAKELTGLLSQHSLSAEKSIKRANWHEFKIAIPIALGFILIFAFLQKSGILNMVDIREVNYGTAFLIGGMASLSTCMAVVGGLVLSMSATYAKKGGKAKPQVLFHLGRTASFFALGGALGALGSFFILGPVSTFIMGILVALVMAVLGLNLLDTFHWAKRLTPSMPKFISKRTLGVSKANHFLAPALLGAATFFLPCGFTQSMQIYALGSGGFWPGALTMLSFALGTLPVLALLSFGSFSIQNSPKSGIFFKSAGLTVIAFALFNLLNSLSAIGLTPPLFNL